MEVFERSKTYRDLYQPANIHHALQMVLIHDDTLLGIVALFRPRTEPDFSLADVKLLEALKEHLALKLWQLTAARQTASPQGQDASLADLFLLTTRELEIVQLVKLGLDNFQICQKLCISKSTLHKHFFNIYRKMNVSNRMQLYRYLVSQKSDQRLFPAKKQERPFPKGPLSFFAVGLYIKKSTTCISCCDLSEGYAIYYTFFNKTR